MTEFDDETAEISSVYGPVSSWRVGLSLGIDLICFNSVCSFNCTYCQLGSIQVRTNERQLFVSTSKVIEDFRNSDWERADIITYSGSGEPTLASNLGESILAIKALTEKPQLVLTNGTLLGREDVRIELSHSDRVYVKLDFASSSSLQKVNRPVAGVTLEQIVTGAEIFRMEYSGYLGIQMMLLYSNVYEYKNFPELLDRIRPDEVQINTPSRPYPDNWYLASRGSHEGVDYPARPLKQVPAERLQEIANYLRANTSGIKQISVRGT